MSSINLFLFSIFILFEVIYSQGCNQHLRACNDGTCCSGLHCKNTNVTKNGLQNFCSIAPCVGDNGKCQKDDGCCYGWRCDKFYNTCQPCQGRSCKTDADCCANYHCVKKETKKGAFIGASVYCDKKH